MKFKLYILRVTAAALIMMPLIQGCSIFPVPESHSVRYYDIGFPEKQYCTGLNLSISPLTGGRGDESRMVFRTTDNRVSFDPYNRWSFTPSALVRRYLQLAFKNCSRPEAVDYIVSGEILRFDGDLQDNTAHLVIKFEIRSPENISDELIGKKIYSSTVKTSRKSATAFAEAMGAAMKEITELFADDIRELKKKLETTPENQPAGKK
jgi:ABC-type uncharacterized transport system auxiliary subunit